jgi:hypothetical protein
MIIGTQSAVLMHSAMFGRLVTKASTSLYSTAMSDIALIVATLDECVWRGITMLSGDMDKCRANSKREAVTCVVLSPT